MAISLYQNTRGKTMYVKIVTKTKA